MGVTNSMVKRTREAKMNALSSALALKIAKEKNDPMYKKYLKLRRAYMGVKQSLIKKYISKGKAAARKAVQKSSD